mgnify:CR=1 FL=1
MKPLHHRRSIRLKGYDYTQPGTYFITMNTHLREWLFGRIVDGVMRLNALGEIALEEWHKTAELRPYVTLDEFCIMPNHVHGIIMINDDSPMGGARSAPTIAPTARDIAPRTGDQPSLGTGAARCAPTVAPTAHSLAAIVRAYKSAVTKRINEIDNTPGMPIWQRNYYEHIVRNEADLTRIREYIRNNPLRWGLAPLSLA